MQYSPCMAITGAIRGTLEETIYQELGLESRISWNNSQNIMGIKLVIFVKFTVCF